MEFDFIEDTTLRTIAEEKWKAGEETRKEETQLQIDQSIAGLKTKNEELLSEKKRIQKSLKDWDGIDPTAAKEAVEFLKNNADAQLIKDGKIEELLEKRTSDIRTKYEGELETLVTQIGGLTESSSKYKKLFESKLLDDALAQAATGAKVLPSAVNDILLNGKSIFSIGEDGAVEARGKDGKILKTKDERVLNTVNWIEERKQTHPHWWGSSEGSGFNPGGDKDDIEAAIRNAAAKGDTTKFRALRAKQAKQAGKK